MEDFCLLISDDATIAIANMWTRKDIVEFKNVLRKDKDAVIKVGHGETVTVSIYVYPCWVY